MLSNISWSSYLTAIIILAVVWYSFLIYKYHLWNIQNLFKRNARQSPRDAKGKTESKPGLFSEYKESFSTLEDAEELYSRLVEVFTESNAGGLTKEVFQNYIRFILSEYPFVKQSALRSKINALAVLESEKYPELLLVYAEMDSLWDEDN